MRNTCVAATLEPVEPAAATKRLSRAGHQPVSKTSREGEGKNPGEGKRKVAKVSFAPGFFHRLVSLEDGVRCSIRSDHAMCMPSTSSP